MKELLAVAFVIALSGCARAKITAWTEDDFTVCCQNARCGREKLNEVAAGRCPSATAKSGFEADGDSTIKSVGWGYGQHQVVETSKRQCVVYQCR